ncbi:olfactory receptor 52K2-like [Megalops cyprinoides]|uniref:olfactory receptor 52K2-like n=1 Tax=Megalops cyprinoides TaxID=118141 RepID=UPI001863B69D|nr:olfactory receptor 52K2-like [Megalops cyprinoides]
MTNLSYVPLEQPIVFTLQGFVVATDEGYPLFVVSLLVYMVMIIGNGTVFMVIVADKKLHKPMYVMVCNLAVCDLLGGTAVMTRLMSDFLTGDKTISYVAAYSQAFTVHTYGSAAPTILSAMAYDRYIAICEPLRYHTIMTAWRLAGLCILAWFIAIGLVAVLFMLNIGTPLCGTLILHVYCSNRSILSLACVPTPINNIYGLCMTWFLSTGSFLVIAFSYIKILIACLVKREKNSKSKAIQTCATHLAVYVLFEFATVLIIVTQRFEEVSPNAKKFCAILFVIIPPAVNPIIYGIVTKEIRTSVFRLFKSPVLPKESKK